MVEVELTPSAAAAPVARPRVVEQRFVQLGLLVQVVGVGGVIGYGLLTGVRSRWYWGVVVIGLLVGAVGALLPWERWRESGRDQLWLVAFDGINALLLAVMMATSGGVASPVRGFLFASAVYAAIAYETLMARVVLTMMAAAYVGVAVVVSPAPPVATVIVELAVAATIAIMVRYVTARLALEEEAHRRLDAIDELRHHVIETASHELRTPVTVIAGLSTTLRTRGATLDDDRRDVLLARLDENAAALVGVVDVLLDLGRLRSGVLAPQVETVRLRDEVERAVDRLAPVLGRHPVTIDVDDVLVATDRVLLTRVLENLLVNVSRHTPAGTAAHVTAQQTGAAVHVVVRDDGPGIETARLRELGGAFDRAGRSSTAPDRGLGLGLTLVSEMLGALGSALRLASGPGEGTRASFELPLVAGRTSTSSHPPAEPRAAAS